MKTLALSDWKAHLRSVGVLSGDLVMVHSAVQFLGKLEGGLPMLYQGLCEVLGPAGTMAFPTFNHGFCRGKMFDVQHTPSEEMGVLNEYVRQCPEAKRSLDPILPVVAVGPLAKQIISSPCPTCFGPDSSFDRLVALGGKLLLIGASFQYASIVHLVEERLRVPYRYMKEFKGIRRNDDREEPVSWWMYVRDRDVMPELELVPMGEQLFSLGLVKRQPINYGLLQLIRLQDLISRLTEWIREDPYFLLSEESKARVKHRYAELGGPSRHADSGASPPKEWFSSISLLQTS